MNLNEMSSPLIPLVLETVERGGVPYHRYASSIGTGLRRRIAEFNDLAEDQVLLEAGADGALRLLFQKLSHERRRLWIPEPSYVGFRHIAAAVGCPIERYGLLDATLQVRKSEPVIPTEDALLICSPNNPFGHVEEGTSRLLDYRKGLTIFDEAYAEFAGPSAAIRQIREGRNDVAVVRTFSKAFGAAGIRLGYLLTSAKLLQSLSAFRLEYAVSCFAIEAGLQLWSLRDRLTEVTSIARRQREALEQSLARLGFRAIGTFPNVTNFFSCLPPAPLEARSLAAKLRESGNTMHLVQTPDLPTLIRITAGSNEENQTIYDRFEQLLAESSPQIAR